MTAVSPIPEDVHTITPCLVVRGATEAIEFYRSAFNAHELYRTMTPDGNSIMHTELLIGNSGFYLSEEFPQLGLLAPAADSDSPVTLRLFVEHVDEVFQQAIAAGARALLPVADRFWGDRYALMRDPFGHKWSIASRLEDLSPEQVAERVRQRFPRHTN